MKLWYFTANPLQQSRCGNIRLAFGKKMAIIIKNKKKYSIIILERILHIAEKKIIIST